MMKNNSDIKSLFASADSRLTIDTGRKQNTLELIRTQIEHKEIRLVCSNRRIWLNQFRYADRNMLLVHLSGCIFILFLMLLMNAKGIDNQFMLVASTILAGVLGAFSILEVSRICFSKLSEISESCFFNISQMTAYDMVFSGLINLCALSAIILFAGFQWKIRLIQIGLYILVPFIFTQCVCLGVLLTEIGRRNVWLIAAIGGFLSVFYVILASMPRLYTESVLFIWVIALLAGAAIFAMQIHTLFKEIGKGEILCTN
ncbi:MAG: hypothetical protein K2L82_09400 [Lachnospiraceae bacterium]|nr:hypothetical protein [Lachnospiraceae bacterium]